MWMEGFDIDVSEEICDYRSIVYMGLDVVVCGFDGYGICEWRGDIE